MLDIRILYYHLVMPLPWYPFSAASVRAACCSVFNRGVSSALCAESTLSSQVEFELGTPCSEDQMNDDCPPLYFSIQQNPDKASTTFANLCQGKRPGAASLFCAIRGYHAAWQSYCVRAALSNLKIFWCRARLCRSSFAQKKLARVIFIFHW